MARSRRDQRRISRSVRNRYPYGHIRQKHLGTIIASGSEILHQFSRRSTFFMLAAAISVSTPGSASAIDGARPNIALQRGYVEADLRLAPDTRFGAIQIIAKGDGSDVLESISCDGVSSVSISLPKSMESYVARSAEGGYMIKAPSLILTPAAGGLPSSGRAIDVDYGHLVLTGFLPSKIGSNLQCEFVFRHAGHLVTQLQAVPYLEMLLRF